MTLLSGFLGSGKTTLLKYILTSKAHQRKIAVIVNDMAELNIDGQDIIMQEDTEDAAASAVRQTNKKEVVTLENGCICCNLRGDLIREIYRIQQTGRFDCVLIESTGIAEPQQVAESFCVDPETMELVHQSNDENTANGDSNGVVDDNILWNSARLDACVTVVDAVHFPQYMSSMKRFQDVFQDGLDDAEESEGEKSISELMVEQVEFANVIVLNKTDLVSKDQCEKAKLLIEALNPKAKVIAASHGQIDLDEVLDTNLFSMEEASQSRDWLLSLKDGVTSAEGEAEEYGVTSFVYRARTPFHPLRLHSFMRQLFVFAEDWNSTALANSMQKEDTSSGQRKKLLENTYGAILRSKGTCWIAGRDDHEISWHQAGQIIQLNPTAPWHCKQEDKSDEDEDDDDDDEDSSHRDRMQALLHDEVDGKSVPYQHGDRRQELVFIGTKLQKSTIEEGLNKCLLTNEEMACHSCESLPIGAYPDPLLPILIPCMGAQSLFMIVRPGQDQHFRIFEGFSFSLQSIALNVTLEETSTMTIKAVKVWLDRSDSIRKGVLLATLRPETYENHALSLPLLACDEEGGEEATNRRIRVELISSRQAEDVESATGAMLSCEVHIIGNVEPVLYSSANGNSSDQDSKDTEEGCFDGDCDM